MGVGVLRVDGHLKVEAKVPRHGRRVEGIGSVPVVRVAEGKGIVHLIFSPSKSN